MKKILTLLIILGGLVLLWYIIGINKSAQDIESAVEVTVEEGSGVSTIADEFEQLGVIKSPFLFKVYTKLSGNSDALQAGTFTVASNASIKDIVELLSGGGTSANEVSVTIVEGWNAEEVEDALTAAGVNVADFAETVVQSDITTRPSNFAFEGAQHFDIEDGWTTGDRFDRGFEGYLFPDTYQFFKDATSEEVIERMVRNFDLKMDTPGTKELLDESRLSFYEVLTLASIVELEVATPEDRKKVAGIFLRRLQDTYPLQSDATVNYVLGTSKLQPTFADTEVDSPYNTYQNAGLPPTPINNPSQDAILAVLQPTESTSYFFLTTAENEVMYADTFDEHLENKAKYLD